MDSLEVLRFLCDVCEYRFFIGQPLEGHSKLFVNMGPEYMHYIPAVNFDVALNVAAGVVYSRLKTVVFARREDLLRSLAAIDNFNFVRNISIMFITNESVGAGIGFNEIRLSEFNAPFDKVVLSATEHNILVIKEGDLSA